MMDFYRGKELLTFEEFTEELCISPSFAYKLLSKGIIKGIKLGKVWRVPRESINDYIFSQLKEH